MILSYSLLDKGDYANKGFETIMLAARSFIIISLHVFNMRIFQLLSFLLP